MKPRACLLQLTSRSELDLLPIWDGYFGFGDYFAMVQKAFLVQDEALAECAALASYFGDGPVYLITSDDLATAASQTTDPHEIRTWVKVGMCFALAPQDYLGTTGLYFEDILNTTPKVH